MITITRPVILLDDLDIPDVPEPCYYANGGKKVELAKSLYDLFRASVPTWQDLGLMQADNGFGLVACITTNRVGIWNDPWQLLTFGFHWGSAGPQCIRNDVRKMRPTVRTGRDTSDLVSRNPKGGFREDKVEPVTEDGHSLWGDLAQAGAVREAHKLLAGPDFPEVIVGADGCKEPWQNDALARFACNCLLGWMGNAHR